MPRKFRMHSVGKISRQNAKHKKTEIHEEKFDSNYDKFRNFPKLSEMPRKGRCAKRRSTKFSIANRRFRSKFVRALATTFEDRARRSQGLGKRSLSLGDITRSASPELSPGSYYSDPEFPTLSPGIFRVQYNFSTGKFYQNCPITTFFF